MMIRELNILEFAEGNPGCIQFLMIASQRPELIDIIKLLRDTGLKGSRAYQLWNDCCGRDIEKVAIVAEAFSSGLLSKEKILEHVDLPFGEPFTEEELKDEGIRRATALAYTDHAAGDPIIQNEIVNRSVQHCAENLFGVKDIGKSFLVTVEAGSTREMGRDVAKIMMQKKEII